MESDSPQEHGNPNKCWSNRDKDLRILGNLFGIALYVLDLSTDIYSAHQHYINGDYYWFGLTVTFIVLPMIICNVAAVISKIAEEKECMTRLIIGLVFAIVTPIVPFAVMALNFVEVLSTHSDKSNTDTQPNTETLPNTNTQPNTNKSTNMKDNFLKGLNEKAALVKLLEVTTESLPQSSLQVYVACHLANGIPEAWQLLTICVSLFALGYSIATNKYVLDKLPNQSLVHKVAIFICVIMFVLSRILVCTTFSLEINTLWWTPIGAEVVVFVITGCCGLFYYYNKSNNADLSIVRDAFRLAITVTLVIPFYFVLAIGGLYLPAVHHQPIAIAALSMAAVTWTATMLGIIYYYRKIKPDNDIEDGIDNNIENGIDNDIETGSDNDIENGINNNIEKLPNSQD